MYRINQIKLGLGETKDKIPEKILKKIGSRDLFISKWNIVKESLDARDKHDIKWNYSVDFALESRGKGVNTEGDFIDDRVRAKLKKAGVTEAPETVYRVPVVEAVPKNFKRPIVVGFGPAGIFAALILAQAGLRPIVIERGKNVELRVKDVAKFWEEGILNTESNVQFGEGGAGAFSDGKLTTGIKDIRIRKVFEEFVRFGAPDEILYRQKPHIGTDILRKVVRNIREEIIRLGGEVKFSSKVTALQIKEGKICGVQVISSEGFRETGSERVYEIACDKVILAIGHSARDTFEMLYDTEIAMEQKPFSIGVRIEHPQELIDIAQYGKPAQELGLPPAEYKMNYKCRNEGLTKGRGVYTFCMCPGGEVILASSQEQGVVVNGMSMHARDSGKANSALLCDVRREDFGSDHVLAGVRFQEKYELLAYRAAGGRYAAPAATWGAFRDGRAPHVESCLPEFAVAALREAMPQLGKKLRGFDSDDAKVYAVETRSSSPVRILRDKTGQSLTAGGLYPCGEGAGYAGGITSAAVDGIKVAEAVISAIDL